MKTLQVITVIRQILLLIVTFYSIYQLVFWLLAYIKPIKKKKLVNKKHRFMAVVAARNEEKVIGNLIDSIQNQSYPSNKIDIYVIADNCTDQTARVAKEAGAIVYERFDEIKKSKGYALEWFFDKVLEEYSNTYDAFCVFDADNLVAPGFFNRMNEKLCEGEEIVQGYRDTKNVGDTWLSANSAIFYWLLNRLYHYSRYNLGLSAFIQGTGFMVSMDVIKEEGWHTTSLTEDIEFSFLQIAKGRKIAWAHDAVVYDEQPTELIPTWHQRLRWGVGNFQSMKKCLPLLLKSKPITSVKIDGLIYLVSLPILFLSMLMGALTFLSVALLPKDQMIHELMMQLITSGVFIAFSYLQVVVVLLLEKKNLKTAWKGIVTYPLFLGLTAIVNASALFCPRLGWKPIQHVKAIKLSELQK